MQKEINSHIEGGLDRLKTLEKQQKTNAGILFSLSAVRTIIVAIIFRARTDFSSVAVETVAIVGVTYLSIAVLIISYSKFLFTLARSFMAEAIKVQIESTQSPSEKSTLTRMTKSFSARK